MASILQARSHRISLTLISTINWKKSLTLRTHRRSWKHRTLGSFREYTWIVNQSEKISYNRKSSNCHRFKITKNSKIFKITLYKQTQGKQPILFKAIAIIQIVAGAMAKAPLTRKPKFLVWTTTHRIDIFLNKIALNLISFIPLFMSLLSRKIWIKF